LASSLVFANSWLPKAANRNHQDKNNSCGCYPMDSGRLALGLLNKTKHELANRERNVVPWCWLFASRLQEKKPHQKQQPLRQFLRHLL
jgi:hypothetical protein